MALEAGAKKIVKVNHRRAGKDLDTWNQMICRAPKVVGTHYYFFPRFAQGRKVIWEGMDNEGRPFLDYVPKSIRDGRPKEDDMQIRIKARKNGKKAYSILQIVGTDKYDSLLGTNLKTGAYSEFQIQDPRAREFFKPIFEANNGVEIFCYTPRGDNHGKDLYDLAVREVDIHKNPEYYVERLTIEHTYDKVNPDGTFVPIISRENYEKQIREGMPIELARQEYYCSFEAGNVGTYYADILERIESEGRIRDVSWEPTHPVDTFWDIGFTDDTSIWFFQFIAGETRVIDCYADSGKGIAHYIKVINQKPYNYRRHTGPHDLRQKQFSSGKSTLDVARNLGVNFEVAPDVSIQDGIDAGRALMLKSYFDREKTVDGRKALRHYHRKWDGREKRFYSRPNHDWSSHYADGWRCAGVSIDASPRLQRPRIKIVNNFSVWSN